MGWNNNTEKRIDLKVAAAGWFVRSEDHIFKHPYQVPTSYLPTYLHLPYQQKIPFFNHPIQIQAPTNSHTTHFEFKFKLKGIHSLSSIPKHEKKFPAGSLPQIELI